MQNDVDSDNLILIVTGAHLVAELADREISYRLRDQILRWHDQYEQIEEIEVMQPVVCSDVWYLNNEPLMTRPVVTVGEPEVNAAAAYLGERLPRAFVIDGRFEIRLDPEMVDLRACVWGMSAAATASAVDVFVERYLDPFLRAVHDL